MGCGQVLPSGKLCLPWSREEKNHCIVYSLRFDTVEIYLWAACAMLCRFTITVVFKLVCRYKIQKLGQKRHVVCHDFDNFSRTIYRCVVDVVMHSNKQTGR